jgi:hypothetical protein
MRRVGGHEQRVAIRRSPCDRGRRDRPVRAGLVLDNDPGAQCLSQFLPDDASNRIRAAAGGERDHQCYHLVRIGVGCRSQALDDGAAADQKRQ